MTGGCTTRGPPEMGFRAGPFVLCKDGCCHQRRRNTNFGPENFFHRKNFPRICVVKMISVTWGSFLTMYVGVGPPPPPGHSRLAKTRTHCCELAEEQWLEVSMAGTSSSAYRPIEAPGTASRAAPAQTPLPAWRPRRGRGGVGQMGFRAIPPLQSNFLPTLARVLAPCSVHGDSYRRQEARVGRYNTMRSRDYLGAFVPLNIIPPVSAMHVV